MEQLVSQVIGALSSVPAVLVYLIAAVWVGIESVGIGLPVEPVMLFLGSLAASGHVNLPLAILISGAGCVAFGVLAYGAGRRFGAQAITRFGRYIGLTPTRADHLELWLRHRGTVGVAVIRTTPLVRSFGSFISGIADIPLPNYALGMFVGSAFYCGVFIVLGNALGASYQAPLHYLDHIHVPVGLVLGVLVVVVALLLLAHRFLGHLAFKRLAHHFHLHHQHEHAQVSTGVADA